MQINPCLYVVFSSKKFSSRVGTLFRTSFLGNGLTSGLYKYPLVTCTAQNQTKMKFVRVVKFQRTFRTQITNTWSAARATTPNANTTFAIGREGCFQVERFYSKFYANRPQLRTSVCLTCCPICLSAQSFTRVMKLPPTRSAIQAVRLKRSFAPLRMTDCSHHSCFWPSSTDKVVTSQEPLTSRRATDLSIDLMREGSELANLPFKQTPRL